jgi:ketosteroid isomerase-like protein
LRPSFLFIIALLAVLGCWSPPIEKANPAIEEQTVRKELKDSVDAWNRGDLDAFMKPYALDARFVTSAGITRGSANILARYRKKYSNRALMGHLSLEIQNFSFNPGLNPTSATVIARWTIKRSSGEILEGETLIVFHKLAEGWLIVEDHSS